VASLVLGLVNRFSFSLPRFASLVLGFLDSVCKFRNVRLASLVLGQVSSRRNIGDELSSYVQLINLRTASPLAK
jgi:hypothetical protein